MPVLKRIGTLVTCHPQGGQADIHLVPGAALVWEGETIRWVGPESDLPAQYADRESWDADGALVIPGLIDCHTHLAFGGWRAEEFEQRIQGSSYLDIARRGGGIMSTVAQTRTMSEDALHAVRSSGDLHSLALATLTRTSPAAASCCSFAATCTVAPATSKR